MMAGGMATAPSWFDGSSTSSGFKHDLSGIINNQSENGDECKEGSPGPSPDSSLSPLPPATEALTDTPSEPRRDSLLPYPELQLEEEEEGGEEKEEGEGEEEEAEKEEEQGQEQEQEQEQEPEQQTAIGGVTGESRMNQIMRVSEVAHTLACRQFKRKHPHPHPEGQPLAGAVTGKGSGSSTIMKSVAAAPTVGGAWKPQCTSGAEAGAHGGRKRLKASNLNLKALAATTQRLLRGTASGIAASTQTIHCSASEPRE